MSKKSINNRPEIDLLDVVRDFRSKRDTTAVSLLGNDGDLPIGPDGHMGRGEKERSVSREFRDYYSVDLDDDARVIAT